MPRVPPVTRATLAIASSPYFNRITMRPAREANVSQAQPFQSYLLQLIPRNTERDAHAAADAQSGEAFLGVAALHLVQQGGQDARAGGPHRVADGDGAAVDVDLVAVEAE